VLEVRVRSLLAGASIPAYARDGDAGADLCALDDVLLARGGGRALVPVGLAIAIPDGYAGLVIPRSGLAASHGITCLNAPGLIDSGYRGEIKVVLLNTDRSERFVVEPGMRIAQLVIVPIALPQPLEVSELPDSDRGEKGFGSSAH
jgi:dUTP diphosphatase